jgi:hypothetical protein
MECRLFVQVVTPTRDVIQEDTAIIGAHHYHTWFQGRCAILVGKDSRIVFSMQVNGVDQLSMLVIVQKEFSG